MIYSILILVCFVSIFLFQMREKNRITPLTVFCSIWIITIFLYSLGLYNIYSISEKAYILLFLGLVLFCLGYVCMKHIKIKHKLNSKENWTFINALVIVDIVVSLPYYFSQLVSLFRSGLTSAAYKFLIITGEVESGGALMQFFVRPMEFIILGMSAYSFFNRKKQNTITAYSGVFICFLKYICTGSKSIFIYYTMCLFVMYLYQKKSRINNFKKSNLKTKGLIICLVIAFVIALSGAGNIFKSFYIYVAGCIPFFDHVISKNYFWNEGMTYGFMSFNGVIRFFNHFLSIIGIELNPQLFFIAENYIARLEYTTTIAPEIKYNAFSTFIANFYIDFGLAGVIVLSFLFGMFSCYIYKIYCNTPNVYTFSLLMLSFYLVLFSIVRFQLSNTVLAMSIIYSLVLLCVSNLNIKLRIKI